MHDVTNKNYRLGESFVRTNSLSMLVFKNSQIFHGRTERDVTFFYDYRKHIRNKKEPRKAVKDLCVTCGVLTHLFLQTDIFLFINYVEAHKILKVLKDPLAKRNRVKQ